MVKLKTITTTDGVYVSLASIMHFINRMVRLYPCYSLVHLRDELERRFEYADKT
jgi:hypothetical protein